MSFRKHLYFFLGLALLLSGCSSVKNSSYYKSINVKNIASISGCVKDDSGKPVADVVVSDGVSVVKTDANGLFTIPYDRASGRFVFVSTPAGYRNSSFRGQNCYYQDIKTDKKFYNFTLVKNTFDDHNSKAIVFADPQIQDTSDLRPFDKRVDDIKAHIKDFKDKEYTFGICLGDMVGWQHILYPRITGKIGELGIDMRYVIGNHDMTNYGRSYETSFREFEKFYGPTYYSFNVGDEHYIVLNDNFYVGRDYFYIGYLDEVQLSWLEKDLAFTPKNKKVVLCIHIPTTVGKADRDNFRYDVISDNLCNKTALYSMLSDYDAIILSGHMHTNTNFVIGTGKGRDGLMEHNLGGFCGTWWCGTVCADGCPPGYKVYSFNGTDMRWYYKSCGYAPDFQGKLYLDHSDYPSLAVAHVWDFDPSWKVEYYEDGKKICDMTRFTGKDPVAKEEFTDPSKHKISWVACLPTPNLFQAPYNAAAKHHEVRITDRFGGVHTISD